jgi:hypothetical protein
MAHGILAGTRSDCRSEVNKRARKWKRSGGKFVSTARKRGHFPQKHRGYRAKTGNYCGWGRVSLLLSPLTLSGIDDPDHPARPKPVALTRAAHAPEPMPDGGGHPLRRNAPVTSANANRPERRSGAQA